MAADGKRKTTGALGVVLALALTVVVAGDSVTCTGLAPDKD